MASIPELELTPDHDLGAVHTLPEFRAIIDSSPMTLAERGPAILISSPARR
ncbi:MAG TPA: hypothetical protein VFX25_30035 [Streptosporangiaceae bacterium]|nr:hypothetical protein [Streptosporangiaceae bacterium]